jgi:FtsH-binding integral membrane protein
LFTLFEAITVSFITGTTSPEIVFMATVMVTGIVLSLTAYAVYTKRDFTMLGGALFLVS